jgi:hypothetical protein
MAASGEYTNQHMKIINAEQMKIAAVFTYAATFL